TLLLSPLLLALLSFSAACDSRPLHSFPTRRSSDLTSAYNLFCVTAAAISGIAPLSVFFRHKKKTCFHSPHYYITNKDMQSSRFRSEEHTSELQSRFDLVCRLLLEKKKSRFIYPTHA